MTTYPFLSSPWIDACRALREEFADRLQPGAVPALKVTLVVTDVPFESGSLDAHLDTSSGEMEIELEHLPDATVGVTVDYTTAKSIFVDGNLGAAMEGLQLGRIKVDGNMFELMALAGIQTDPNSIELAKRIREITE